MANVVTNTSSGSTAGKPIHCKAAVARKAGQPLDIEEVIVAPPKAHEVRIKILCTSLCHTDITFWKMEDGCYPRIFGHEAVGMVESVGEGVDEVVEGDYVVPVFLSDCGDCRDCKSTESNLCSKFPFEISPWMPREESTRFTSLKGETISHFVYVSSFSQYTVVDITHLVKIDNSIPPDRACLLGCGISTGMGAALRVANVKPGTSAVVFGMGAIGLAVAEAARFRGATKIIAVDVNPEKFETAKKFGVTHFINPKDCKDKTVSQLICEMTDGGADYCFECVGMASLVQEAYASSRKGWGKTVVLGVDKPESQLSINSVDMLFTGRSVTGCLFGGLKVKSDVPMLAKHYMDKEIQLDGFVTHEMKFEEINKAYEMLMAGKCIRCVLWMD